MKRIIQIEYFGTVSSRSFDLSLFLNLPLCVCLCIYLFPFLSDTRESVESCPIKHTHQQTIYELVIFWIKVTKFKDIQTYRNITQTCKTLDQFKQYLTLSVVKQANDHVSKNNKHNSLINYWSALLCVYNKHKPKCKLQNMISVFENW